MASYQVGAICYRSELEALQAMASQMFGTGFNESGAFSFFTYVNSENHLVTRTSLNTEISISPTLQPCNLFDIEDAVAWGSIVITAFILAFKFKMAGRAFLSSRDSEH